MKAELLKKKQEYEKQKATSAVPPFVKAKKKPKESKTETETAVDKERFASSGKKSNLNVESGRAEEEWEKSRASLTAKSRLYEQLEKGRLSGTY